jgi:hypothetical protein
LAVIVEDNFYHIDTWANVIKLFLRNLLTNFVLSLSVGLTLLEKLATDKHYRLLRKFVNYREKVL